MGKTWLLKEFGRKEFRNIHYINFENSQDLEVLFKDGLKPDLILAQLKLLSNTTVDPEHDLIVFDEIQNAPDALTSLKYFNEDMPQMAVCGAGSHIGLTVSEGSFPVGQVEFLDVYPMNFEEFLMNLEPHVATFMKNIGPGTIVTSPVHDRLLKLWREYLFTGGLPAAVATYTEHRADIHAAATHVRAIQSILIGGYQSDFAKHAGRVNATHINAVFRNIPIQLFRAMDGSVGRFRFRGILPNRSRYAQFESPIEWLVKAGLALQVHPLESPTIPLMAFAKMGIFKLYFFDVGLLGCMLGLSANSILNQDYGSYKGYIAENYVAQEFVAARRDRLYSWHGRESEIEFLRMIDDKVVPVEVKSGTNTRSKSLAAYRDKYSPHLAIKITAKELDTSNPAVHNYPIYLASRV